MRCNFPHGPHHTHGRKFFWRIYAHGLLMLVAVGAAMAALAGAWGRGGWWHEFPNRLALYMTETVSASLHDDARVQAELQRIARTLGMEATIYNLDGTVRATTVAPPVPSLEECELDRLSSHRPVRTGDMHWLAAAPVRKDGQLVGYLAFGSRREWGVPVVKALSGLLLVLLVLALVSIPAARAMTRPLERVTATARAFGEGDLAARTGIRGADEVGELAQAFDEMAARLERLVLSEKELLANVSHELRTPLARIRVALELAAEGDAETARRYLQEVGSDLSELNQLVEDILTAARMDLVIGRHSAAETPLRRTLVEGGDLIAQVAERFKKAHPTRTLVVDVQEPLPTVDADPALLRRVIDNLVDNARKYSDGEVTVRARAVDGELVVEVLDRGIGMEPDDVERLFTPFFRTERSRARGTGGVGLGLALAKRIVEAHGGTISASSEPGRGTTIRFSVPGILDANTGEAAA
ncbi:MAG: ATP-binding protein [Myxococcota bacterium]